MKKKISQKVEMDKDLTSIQGSAVFISTSLYILFSQLAIIIAAVKIVGIMFIPSPYAIEGRSISGLPCTSSVFRLIISTGGQHYYYNYILRTQLQFPQPKKLPEGEQGKAVKQGTKLFGFHSGRWAGADMPKHWHYVHAILVWHGTGRHKAAQHGAELGLGLARALTVAVALAGMPDPPTRAEWSLGHLLLAACRGKSPVRSELDTIADTSC